MSGCIGTGPQNVPISGKETVTHQDDPQQLYVIRREGLQWDVLACNNPCYVWDQLCNDYRQLRAGINGVLDEVLEICGE